MGRGSGKGGAVSKRRDAPTAIQEPNDTETKELLIDGRLYDITNFIRKHPGGKVLTFYMGQDASEAFEEFHSRSPTAKKWLNGLPSRPNDASVTPSTEDPLIADFKKFKQDLVDEGFFKPSPMHVAYRLTELLVMHLMGFYMMSAGWTMFGLAMLGLASGRCGWLMHEGGHYSLTGNIKLDRHIQMFTYGLGCGMSGSYWRNQHNKHHATPQKIGHDVDLLTMPLVAFNKKCAFNRKGKIIGSKLWIKYQAKLFAPVTCELVSLGWQFYLHPRFAIRTKNVVELGWMLARYLIIGLYFGHHGLAAVVKGYLFYNWCASSYIFCNFAVSHTHLDTNDPEERIDWVRYSSDFTINCENTWWCNWWMSYLNFQIEHHLFPSLPQFRAPEISPRVKALFEKHGVKYDQRGYFACLKTTFDNLHNVGYDVFYG